MQHKNPLRKKVTEIPKAQYGGRHTVTMLPGGGIGSELMNYVREIFRYAGVPVDFEIIDIDPNSESDEDLDYAINSIKRNGVAIKGNIETKSLQAGITSRNVAIRNELDLFVSVLNCKSYPSVRSHHQNVDLVVIRQNTEGEYAMLEHESVKGVVESMKIITVEATERLSRYAFEYARRNGRKKVTTIHKANIMKISDGCFLETSRRVAKEYPDIQHNDMIIDNTCMQLVSNPHQFDVLLTTNLYGSITSNVICGLIGGAGLLSGRNYGEHYAVFEPGTRNTGTSIAGKNLANPFAMLNASVDMLNHLGHQQHANAIADAIFETIVTDRIHTAGEWNGEVPVGAKFQFFSSILDLGGSASSTDCIQNVLKHLAEKHVSW